jgi:hypothetical protein
MMKYLAIGLKLLALPASATTFEGVYSNVCLDPETGDQDGIELQLQVAGGAPVVTFKTCEGGCWEQPVSDVAVDGNHITFRATDQDFTPDGKLADSKVHRFDGTFGKRALDLESPGYYERQHLNKRRLRKPLDGGDKAKWPAAVKRCGVD